MTLATILLCIACSTPPLADSLPAVAQASQNQTPQNDTGTTPQNGKQGTATSPPPTTVTPEQQPKPRTSRRWKRKKKTTANGAVECPPLTPGAPSSATGPTPGDSAKTTPQGQAQPTPAGPDRTQSNQAPASPMPAKAPGANANASPENCPPMKTVVREGGTTEPAIQLVGGKNTEQASQQRSTTDQLLGSTEDNLKKVAGRPLNSSEQEMVNQIQAFMEQSRAAVSAGDMERGHNLALKAHLLSDELVKP